MHALLQWNNCIYIAALFDEISSQNNKSERNDNIFIRTFRSPHVYGTYEKCTEDKKTEIHVFK